MNRVRLYSLAFLVVSCGSSAATQTVLPNGKTGFVVTCTDPSDCLLQAGKACPIGYETVSKETKKSMEVNSIAQYNYGSCIGQKQVNAKAQCDDTPPTPVEVERTTMLVSCGAPTPDPEKREAEHATQEPAQSAPPAIACTVLSAKKRQFSIHFSAKSTAAGDGENATSDCTFLPNDDDMAVPDEKSSDGSFSYGPMFSSCTVGLEETQDADCTLSKIWSCTDNKEGKVWGFAIKIHEDPSTHKITGQFMVHVDIQPACQRIYNVSLSS